MYAINENRTTLLDVINDVILRVDFRHEGDGQEKSRYEFSLPSGNQSLQSLDLCRVSYRKLNSFGYLKK